MFHLPDLDRPEIHLVETAPSELQSQAEQRAQEVVRAATQEGQRLMDLITKRGRGSANASACRTMVSDYLLGLGDLQGKLDRISSGDARAAGEIPGLLAAFQESLNFKDLLGRMKGYGKSGDLAAYIGETVRSLSASFDSVAESVRPLSEAMAVEAVRGQVREQVSAAGNYRFHVLKAKPTPAVAVQVARPGSSTLAPMPTVEPWTPLERAFFEAGDRMNQTVGAQEVTRKVAEPSTWMGRFGNGVRKVLGDVFSPRNFRLGGMVLALAGCGDGNGSSDPFPDYPIKASAPAPDPTPAPDPGPQFKVADDASSLWAGIRDSIKGQCTGMTKAQLEKATGGLVAESFKAKANGYESLVKVKQTTDKDGEWLGKVAADEAKYGNTVPTDYPGVLASARTTAVVGAHNMPGATIVEYGNAVLTGYQCPSN